MRQGSSGEIVSGVLTLVPLTLVLVFAKALPVEILHSAYWDNLGYLSVPVAALAGFLVVVIGRLQVMGSVLLRHGFRFISVKKQYRHEVQKPKVTLLDGLPISFPIGLLFLAIALCFATEFSGESLVRAAAVAIQIPGFALFFICACEVFERGQVLLSDCK